MNKKGFTLVELVVVMSILVILSSISFITYSRYLSQARDSQRIADLAQLGSALELYTKQVGELPSPGNGNDKDGVFQIGKLDENTTINTVNIIPKDPKIKQAYVYSKVINSKEKNWGNENNHEYQLAATLEGDGTPVALVRGNYYPVASDYPSIITTSPSSTYFVLDNQSLNLPYTFTPEYEGSGNSDFEAMKKEIKEKTGTDFTYRNPFTDCDQLKKAGKFIGPREYKLSSGEKQCN
ncbi:type II secretion system protein [Candidatus Gracilibacteria bacterium]|nr:MAG: type II secretion system protein [Candidatus Gracilibacteria bacterium]